MQYQLNKSQRWKPPNRKESMIMQDIESFKHYIMQLFDNPAWKLIAGCFIAAIKLAYGPVVRPAYGIVISLWLIDTTTGVYHAWKNPAVVPESRHMYHGLVKLAVYYFLLFLAYQCGQVVLTACLQGLIEGAILLTESYSILENIEKIVALEGMKIPLLKAAMRLLKGKIEQIEGKEDES